jgi:molybdenum cofactor guanylyltransferase
VAELGKSLLNLRGWVLAGGASSRMGQDKSALLFGTQSLLDLAMEKVNLVCGDATVLCGRHTQRTTGTFKAVADLRGACGPLGGIEAALHHTDSEWNLFLAVDTPLIPAALLCAWVEKVLVEKSSLSGKTGGAVFSDQGRIHALPLLLHRSILDQITASLENGEYRVLQQIYHAVEASGFSVEVTDVESIIAQWDPFDRVERSQWFANANTPDEFERIRQLLKR